MTAEFGKGYTVRNLRAMRQFYQFFPIRHALRAELTWTHYRMLMRVIVIDLKTDKLTYQDVGQIDYYVRLFDEKVKQEDDNPTIGLVLVTDRDESIVKYSVLADNENLFASKYRLYLPSEEELKAVLQRERDLLERQIKENEEKE